MMDPKPLDFSEAGLPRPVIDGLPVPYSGDDYRHGMPHTTRLAQCVKEDLCGVCGDKLRARRWIAVGAIKGDVLDKVGMHERCAKLSLAHCPHMSAGFSRVVWAVKGEYDGSKHKLTERQLKGRQLKLTSTAAQPNLLEEWRPSSEDWPSVEDALAQQTAARVQPALNAYAAACGETLDISGPTTAELTVRLVGELLAHLEMDHCVAGLLSDSVREYMTVPGADKPPTKADVKRLLTDAAKAA